MQGVRHKVLDGHRKRKVSEAMCQKQCDVTQKQGRHVLLAVSSNAVAP